MRRVFALGLDGFDPVRVDRLIGEGRLPHLRSLATHGASARIATTAPAQTPVAWSTVAVGANPGVHGIFDFLRRDPATYRPDQALFGVERRSAFLPPRVVNRRGGTPVWERLGEAGIPSTILRHPCTYPPERVRGRHRLLSGVGVPDLRGGFGTATVFTSDLEARAGQGERLVTLLAGRDGTFRTHLLGPPASDGEDSRVELEISAGPSDDGLRLSLAGGATVPLDPDQWTEWLGVLFKVGPMQRVRGRVRFRLVRRDPLVLYASPVNPDPYAPAVPISDPWDYARELDEALGPYHTLGMAEDHAGLENGRLDEDAFLDQCATVLDERRAMLLHELNRFEEGLLFCVVDTPDRIQHMLWRHGEPDHPANAIHGHDPGRAALIDEHYEACDRLVGEVTAAAGAESLVMVLSDHGFTGFRRQLDLNAWLREQGLLVLRDGTDADDLHAGMADGIDWERSRAYAVGMAGIFLNVEGREARGTVTSAEAPELAGRIADELVALRDPERGGRAPVRRAETGRDLYRGDHVADAPDVVVGCTPGYRVASRSALGGMGLEVLLDNTRRWSGDHVVDPEAVPGFFAMDRPFHADGLHLVDVAPTILAALGAPGAPEMEGRSLL